REEHHDVVLLDMRLPGLDGLGVLEAIRHEPHPPPVVLMSGYLDVPSTLAALQRGAVEVLEKPIEPQRLMRVVRDVAHRHRAKGARPGVEHGVPELVGSSRPMQLLREQIMVVARYPALPLLIIGETGTGKELVARAVHRLGDRKGPQVSINCAAMPESLFESEVFGHEAGAFTGARCTRTGLFQAAAGGTVFFDEVGELPISQQTKLLRVLEDHSFRRVGSNQEIPLRARIVSATNRPLRGRSDDPMRPDLYFRLAGHTIRTPPLRVRLEDIEALAAHFLRRLAKDNPTTPTAISPRALAALMTHDWPGNVRELRAVVQSAAIRSVGSVIGVGPVVEALHERGCLERAGERTPDADPQGRGAEQTREADEAGRARPVAQPAGGLPQVERELVTRTYSECEGNLSLAARRLKIPRSTLRDKLRRYGLR
ncbi:MAG: sigma-54-dependent Fis family transcriptional regulator, partial [Myxococcales bacterium]|nr:sigma-54-dependent Fis family transcriptional regulator [Myxococcales bacterium]